MLKSLFLFLAASTTAIAFTAGASERSGTSSLQMPKLGSKKTGYTSQGVRVGAFKPMLTTQSSSDVNGQVVTRSGGSTNDSVGFSVGYISMPVYRLGWEAALSGFSMRDTATTNFNLRVVGNLTAALNSGVYFKSGVNVSDMTGNVVLPGGPASVSPGLGFQLGSGYQINQNFGVDASYVWLSQKHDRAGELFQQGVELALTGTF